LYVNKTSVVSLVTINVKCYTVVPNPSIIQNMTQACDLVQSALERAAQRLQSVVLFIAPITIDTTFSSFCYSDTGGDPNCTWSGILGAAAPSSWFLFNSGAAEQIGVDSVSG
jgi:hypothetical protein